MSVQRKSESIQKYGILLRQCAKDKNLSEGKRLHAEIVFISPNTYLANLLVQMYGSCGCVDSSRSLFDATPQRNVFSWTIMLVVYAQNGQLHMSRNIFDKMPERSVISWNAMIAACTQNGEEDEALQVYESVAAQGVEPNKITFTSIFYACARLGAVEVGRVYHARAQELGLLSESVHSALLNMYGKCGCIQEAWNVFEKIVEPDVISWTAMVTACGQNGYLQDARALFDEMPEKNGVSWTAMITASIQNGCNHEAMRLFRKMDVEGVEVNIITFISVIEACANLGALKDGKMIHSLLVATDLESDISLGNALVNMYGKCGRPLDATNVFLEMRRRDTITWNTMIAVYAHNGNLQEAVKILEEMPNRDVVSWNTIIGAFSQCGYEHEAMRMHRRMMLEGWKPDKMTFISVAYACQKLSEAKAVHAFIGESVYYGDLFLQNAMINMYGKCKSLEDAKMVFDGLKLKDIVSWTAVIGAYGQNGDGKGAAMMFRIMDIEGIQCNEVTFVTICDACSSGISSLAEVRSIHKCLLDAKFNFNSMSLNSLMDAYSKCGSLQDAKNIFDQVPERDVVSWTAIMSAFGRGGHGKVSLDYFRAMQLEGIPPNSISFMAILFACNHSGMLKDALLCFSICFDYGATPTMDQYLCIIDLIGRAGQLEEAHNLINSMPYEPHSIAWTMLLSGCKIQSD